MTGCAHLLRAIAGHDPHDSTSVNRPVPDYVARLDGSVKGLRIGIPREYFVEGMQPEVEQAVRAAVARLEALGAHGRAGLAAAHRVRDPGLLPDRHRRGELEPGALRRHQVRPARAPSRRACSSMYQRTRAAGFGTEVKRRIMLGTYALSAGYYDAYYLKAQKVRTLIRRDFEQVFATHDVIVTPTAPTTAFRIGEKTSDPLQMYLSDIFTISVNLAGLPGLSLPCGFDQAGLPIGLQIVGRPFDEERVLQAAYAYEQATEWHGRKCQ